MKLEVKLHAEPEPSEHRLELQGPAGDGATTGRLQFLLDGEAGEADCAEVARGVYSIILNGRSYEVRIEPQPIPPAQATRVIVGTRQYDVEIHDPRSRRRSASAAASHGPRDIMAPMPGKIVKMLVSEGQEVASGQGLLVIEAMKMQNEIRASRPGRVERIYVQEGAGVEAGSKLLRLA